MRSAIKLGHGAAISLPSSAVGRADISRMLREIEKIDYNLETESIRNPEKAAKLKVVPSMSRVLAETVTLNKVTVTDLHSRKQLIEGLHEIKEKSPILHITFAEEPDPSLVTTTVEWARKHLYKNALVSVGLQPNILGGCIVRTPSHVYDFSLRGRFASKLPELREQIKTVVS